MEHDVDTYREVVAAEVRALMARRRVTQADLGSVLGVNQSAVSKRLRGVRAFDLDDVERMCRYFDVSLSKLLPEPITSDLRERSSSCIIEFPAPMSLREDVAA